MWNPTIESKHSHESLFRQATLAGTVALDGVGIHTGKTVSVRLVPAPAGAGIVFRRTDCGGLEIPALVESVCSLELATTIGRDDITVSTIEHLMAALHVARVDNLYVDIDGPEVPILDGSSLPYCRLIEAAGIRHQNAYRKILVVTEPVEVHLGDKSIRISPFPGVRVSYRLDYRSPIGQQAIDLEITRENFDRELAAARTFGLAEDVERLHACGLGLGGRPDNCIVFGEHGPLHGELRYEREPVRHKALDAIGDLALVGSPFWGHVEVERGGHLLHFQLLETLLSRPSAFTWARGDESTPDGLLDLPGFRQPHPTAVL